MSAAAPAHGGDPYALGRRPAHGHGGHSRGEATGHGEGGPASKPIITAYGFWIFLLSDIIMFSGFFAAYAVLSGETAGGPSGHQLFDLRRVAIETGLLLASSFTAGLRQRCDRAQETWRGRKAGCSSPGCLASRSWRLSCRSSPNWSREGPGRRAARSCRPSSALVGCHGLHVGVGLLWLGTMMAQLWVKGFRENILRRLFCFNLFWHALDIIWVALFTVVYLLGAGQ